MNMMRSSSPAFSEISVGSPSPPPTIGANSTAFRTISLKRLRAQSPAQMQVPRKSKSFSIADILGKKEENSANTVLDTEVDLPKSPLSPLSPTRRHQQPTQAQTVPNFPLSKIVAPLSPGSLPANLSTQWEGMGRSAPLLPISIVPASLPHHLHPFFPPALLQYDPRLAWDYQRQLQEHFQIQAQLLRQMSMDPGIIPSDDGSERSHSNFTGSDCSQSPDVSVVGNDGNNSKSIEAKENDNEDLNDRQDNEEDNKKKNSNVNDTPLDALFQLSTKNFDEDQDPTALNIFATRQNPKKKRKSRTAFTNHQIFELEKRFLYQKYLSPADRDEIAAGLGLSNAQVITWFQNRRAKLKRDMEELKKDVESVKQLSAHKSFLENVNDLSILKTRPVSRHQQPSLPAASLTVGACQQLHQPSVAISSTIITATPITTTATTATTADEIYKQQSCPCSPSPTSTSIAISYSRATTNDVTANNSTQRLQINNSRG